MIGEGIEVASISSTSSLSQHTLKDNYVKARFEREREQEQAELEKRRLQEILDLCMEFTQRQESLLSKSANSSSSTIRPTHLMMPNSSSNTSSSISSECMYNKTTKQCEEDLIASLPKLTSILNLNASKQTHVKLSNSTRSTNFDVSFFVYCYPIFDLFFFSSPKDLFSFFSFMKICKLSSIRISLLSTFTIKNIIKQYKE